MTGSPVLDVLLFLASLFLATVVSVAEFAITSASRSTLDQLIEDGEDGARAALRLKEHDEDVQGTAQIATIFLVLFSALILAPYVGHWVHQLFEADGSGWISPLLRVTGSFLVAGALTGFFLVGVHLFAKGIGEKYGDAIVLRFSGGMYLLSRLLHIPQRLLIISANLFLRPFRGKARFSEAVTTEENLLDILEEGAKTGLLDQTEHELIESIFQFTDTTAREIMIPRTDMVGVDINMPATKVLERFIEQGFTRMPVYNESLDDILGIIYAKDVISLVEHRHLIILQDIIRPPFVVPETKPISELLREFQFKRLHMAIVVDEFGGTEGLITMEDILEEIVGEIRDEYDDEEIPYERLPGGGIEVEAMVNISDFNSYADFTIPDSDDYDTVGGFVTTLLGRIPDQGDVVPYPPSMQIEIVGAEERRVTRVRFTRTEEENGTKSDD
ncbi:MAG: hypothetical protein C0600_15275 [Ignavibacteria bacterium]|nr:MAG: hypothetical protein C0600_15275 [Ignavibacteria bacterium]